MQNTKCVCIFLVMKCGSVVCGGGGGGGETSPRGENAMSVVLPSILEHVNLVGSNSEKSKETKASVKN
jgi:hypothetical protein